MTSLFTSPRFALLLLILASRPAPALAESAACTTRDGSLKNLVTKSDVEKVLAFRSAEEKRSRNSEQTSRNPYAHERVSTTMRFDVGATYFTNEYGVKDTRQALAWFQSAASRGDVEAAMIVGYMYATGTGAPADCLEATKWFCQAGNSGIEEIKFAMGTRCSSAIDEDLAPELVLH